LGNEETKIGKIEVMNNSLADRKAAQCRILEEKAFEKGSTVRKEVNTLIPCFL
jgi:hypothetical protein